MDSNLSINILDYEDMECPYAIYEGRKMDLEMLKMVRQITMYDTIACPHFPLT